MRNLEDTLDDVPETRRTSLPRVRAIGTCGRLRRDRDLEHRSKRALITLLPARFVLINVR